VGIDKNEDFMSHTVGGSMKKLHKKTDLDAVRETENEDGNKNRKP